MNSFFCFGEPSQWINRNWLNQRGSLPFFGKDAREIVHCGGAEAFALTEKHDAIAGITNARRVLQHRLEDRFKLAGRAADNLEHVSGRRQLLPRLVALADEPRNVCYLVRSDG
ncbi:MAG: hypothetical protein WBQ54_13245, partial [Pseudolabrys sp.]